MTIPLEDTVVDIVGKAQRGLGFSDAELSARSGVDLADLQSLLQGKPLLYPDLEKIARALELGPRALFAIAEGTYHPHVTPPVAGFFQASTPYGDIFVNSYLVWDTASRLAAAFDTGVDATPLLEAIRANHLVLQDVYLTHSHVDHVMELDRLCEKAGGSIGVHISQAEPLDGASTFAPGVTFSLGRLHFETRDTSGHSAGGTTYHVHGLDRPLAIVGDALFAGSVGGIRTDYRASLKRIRDHILSGQDGTVLAPGHGPLTSVILEKTHNPFFPEFRQTLATDI